VKFAYLKDIRLLLFIAQVKNAKFVRVISVTSLPIIKNNVSLKPYNTFGIDVNAKRFLEINNPVELTEVQKIADMYPVLILGGGSNILFTRDYEGIVIKNNLKGIELVRETETEVWVKAASGEIWHELVLYCISKNYGGIENLSLIPGTVGAAPIQNIGAYGAELKDVFDSLEALNLDDLSLTTFNSKECRFGYRDSIFKQETKGQYLITSVTIRLHKFPQINTSYGAIQAVLDQKGISHPTIADVSAVVCEIRNSKLPNPAIIGNAGSFFKNPEIPENEYLALKDKYPGMPGYKTHHGIKIPAGWLIESCGWKGKRIGNTGSHKDQALVLVNYGNASGEEVKALASEIIASVKSKFGVTLQTEVNII